MNTFNVADYLAGTVTAPGPGSPGSYVAADSADSAVPPSTPRMYTNFHIVVLSLGEDGAGAYDQNGNLYSPCIAGRADTENCDDKNGTFFNPIHADLGNNQTAGGGSVDGAYHYDDIMVEIADVPTGIWSYSQKDNNDITTFRRVAVGVTDQGIPVDDNGVPLTGNTNFDDTIVLDVGGDPLLKVGAGVLSTTVAGISEICDVKGNNCFSPEALGGDATSGHITCGTADADGNATPMTGIAQATGLCTYKLPAIPNMTCPLGHRAIGFNMGQIVCD